MSTSNEQELKELRARIDALDEQLLKLINQRAALAKQVAATKGGAIENDGYYRPEREAQVLRNVIAANPGPLPDEEVARLFREVMSACLALQRPLDVAFLGPEGTFTHAAVLKHFGQSVHAMPMGTIGDVFREVEAGACHYGIVPVENSIEGVVNHTLDMFVNSSLKICGEVELRIHHHLLSKTGGLDEPQRVYAHEQALAQCRRWLDNQLPRAERRALSSNAEAARRAAQEPGSAAIAGDAAANLYGLQRLASNIEDETDNTTRFLVIGHQSTPPSGDDKTSLIFSTSNQPGALYKMLGAFAEHGISMMRIESRPSRRGMWDYVFFVDVEGHLRDALVAEALKDLKQRAAMVKLLGSYPRAVL
ncbi:MAG: prephenate dehydratase [Gammaproteobacteria bacterium]